MSDLSLDVNFEGSGIEVDAEFGYSNTRYVSPSEYTGELTVIPSHERHILETTGKMLNGNVTVEAAPTSEVIFTENGEYLPPEGEVGFRKVEVDVPQKITFESFTLGNYPFGDVKIDASITDFRTRIQNQLGITSIDFQNVKKTNEVTDLFYGCTNLRTIYAPKMELVGNSLFKNCYALYENDTINLAEIMPVATTFNSWVFTHCRFTKMILPTTIKRIYLRAFGEIPSLHTVYFTGGAEYVVLDNSIFDATVTEIYVPWSEGAVRNAPWGATSATIHYDTVYDSEWNVISST